MVSKRFSKANNPKTWIQYYDTNNLYGWAMSQALPTGGFEWALPSEADLENVLSPDSEKGYILEVDIEYSEELHNTHNSYPLAPERRKVDNDWLSAADYQQNLLKELYRGRPAKIEKLVPNL